MVTTISPQIANHMLAKASVRATLGNTKTMAKLSRTQRAKLSELCLVSAKELGLDTPTPTEVIEHVILLMRSLKR